MSQTKSVTYQSQNSSDKSSDSSSITEEKIEYLSEYAKSLCGSMSELNSSDEADNTRSHNAIADILSEVIDEVVHFEKSPCSSKYKSSNYETIQDWLGHSEPHIPQTFDHIDNETKDVSLQYKCDACHSSFDSSLLLYAHKNTHDITTNKCTPANENFLLSEIEVKTLLTSVPKGGDKSFLEQCYNQYPKK